MMLAGILPSMLSRERGLCCCIALAASISATLPGSSPRAGGRSSPCGVEAWLRALELAGETPPRLKNDASLRSPNSPRSRALSEATGSSSAPRTPDHEQRQLGPE